MALSLAACQSAAAPTPTLLPGNDVGAVIVTRDLAVGENRVAFALIDKNGMPVRPEQTQVKAGFLAEGTPQADVRAESEAVFVRWPGGQRGALVTTLTFDTPGYWQLEATGELPNGETVTAVGAFEVKEHSETPAIGEPAPPSETLTAAAAPDLSQITTDPEPDPDLYQLSIAEALQTGKPLVVTFATPAFCVSATCGPQVDEVARLKDKYKGQANFIHVEVVKNPQEAQGNRANLTYVEAVSEWGLPTEPWTFVIDGSGTVQAKFEQFTPLEELEAALLPLL